MREFGQSETPFRTKLFRLISKLHTEFGGLFHITLLFSLLQVLLDLAGIGLLIQVIWITTGHVSEPLIPIPVHNSMLITLLWLFGFFLVKNVLSLIIYAQSLKNYYKIGLQFAEKKIGALVSKGFDFNKQNSSSISQDIYNVCFNFSQTVLTSLFQFITETTAGVGLLIFAWFMTGNIFLIIMLLLLPASILMFKQIKSSIRLRGKKNNDLVIGLYALMNDIVFGYNELVVMQKIQSYKNRFLDQIRALHQNKIRLMLMGDAFNFRFIEVSAVLVLLMIVAYLEWVGKRESFAEIVAVFGIVAFRMLPSLNRITGSLNHLHQQSHVIDAALNLESSIAPVSSEAIVPEEIQIRNLSFAYEHENQILKNVSFSLKKGNIHAISGPSGIGKSTLLHLICGVLTPDSGEILVNGTPIENTPLYQKIRMSLVSQDVYLFEGSIAENICLQKQISQNDPELISALKQAELYEWISTLENREFTHVGEWGKLISGGQKQRMAIARALYHHADFLILDEATRALDHENEQSILQTLKTLALKGKIILMVSHNRDVLEQADQIIHLNR